MTKPSFKFWHAILCATILFASSAFAEEVYRVSKGDNLGAIGKKFGVSYKEIMAANQLKNTTIYVGQVLRIPTKEAVRTTTGYTAAPHTYPTPASDRITAPVRPNLYPAPVPAPVVIDPSVNPYDTGRAPIRGVTEHCNANYRGGNYVVQRGDSVRSISRKFGIAFWDLRTENDLWLTKLSPGMVLKIPTRAASVGIAF